MKRSLIILAVLLWSGVAAADTITVGLYAPTAPFGGSGDRVSFINSLAKHLEEDAGGNTVSGKVFSSASAFASAVKKGEVQFAVVDAPYAAAQGLPYKILAAATRNGSSTASWQLVATGGIKKLADLEGKKIAIPGTGSKVNAFLTNALFGGEVDASYFGKIIEAGDGNSAATMVSVGKADAAVVPSGTDLSGATVVMNLTSVGWPMFVSLPGADSALVTAFGKKVKSFSSSGAFSGFGSADSGKYKSLSGSFGRGSKKGPMVVPPAARLTVKDILEGRSFSIPLSNVLDLVEAPTGTPRKATPKPAK